MKSFRVLLPLVLACVASACGGSSSPTIPTGPGTLTTPTDDSPAEGAQLDNVRPTLTVVNMTTTQSGAKTYEFELSDNPASAKGNAFVAPTLTSPAVAEDPSGKTTFTVTQDLQQNVKYYWHARLVQGASNSDWSATRSFITKIVGFNRPGALFNPLINGETIGDIGGSGNVTFIQGQGIRMNDERAFVSYQLPQTYSSGEMSVEVTGLNPFGPCCKPRIFSMLDALGQIASSSRYSFNVQYRGAGGAPDNCITFKAILGDNANSVEPDNRFANTAILDPSKVYLWQAFWTPTSFRLVVREGGLTGPVISDVTDNATSATTNWNPDRMFAFLGTNNGSFVQFDGTRAGMILKNLWVGSTPRPTNLGSGSAQAR